MTLCPCGATVIQPGHRRCTACEREERQRELPLAAAGPPCPRCGRPSLPPLELLTLFQAGRDAYYKWIHTPPAAVLTALRAGLAHFECATQRCYVSERKP